MLRGLVPDVDGTATAVVPVVTTVVVDVRVVPTSVRVFAVLPPTDGVIAADDEGRTTRKHAVRKHRGNREEKRNHELFHYKPFRAMSP